MWIGVVTLFPDLVHAVVSTGVLSRAVAQGGLQIAAFNPRDFATDRHRTVDDRPYGGGPGMVMMVEPLLAAIDAARTAAPAPARVVLLTPQGTRLDQQRVTGLSREPALVLVAGRYEGIDERLVALAVDEEVSIGDYVLTGGELAAMVVTDAVARFLPGTLGNEASRLAESHLDGKLDCPHYTRPERVRGLEVPAVLLSGDHRAVDRWRHREALRRTFERRPDLLVGRMLSDDERTLLDEVLTDEGREG
jgi:tRNA (guanine37-N1)-methyltransferase